MWFYRDIAGSLRGVGAVVPGEFWHVAATYDGKAMKVYVDGELVGEDARGPQTTDVVTPVLIGASHAGNVPGPFFYGVIDEVALFNVALSENDVREAMAGLAGPEAVTLVAKAAVTWVGLRRGI